MFLFKNIQKLIFRNNLSEIRSESLADGLDRPLYRGATQRHMGKSCSQINYMSEEDR